MISFFFAIRSAFKVKTLLEPRYQSLMAVVWAAGFMLVLVSFLNESGLRICLPSDTPVGPENTKGYLWLGCALLAGGFAWFRPDPMRKEMDRPSAWAWFSVIMAVAAYLRLSHFHDPAPFYWDDYSLSMVDAKSALDLPTERYLVFPAGCRQPFFQYVITLGYGLFPNLPTLELQNIVWALIDLCAIWIHYLLGREVGGRRTGLLLAALVSVTKPTLVNSLTGQSPVTTPLSVGLMLLMTWRFYRRPDMRHTLQWGASLAFGAYCYNAARPFMGFLPFVVLATVLWKHRQRTDRMYRVLGVGSLIAFCYLFFQVNRYILPLGKLLHLPGGNSLVVLALFGLGLLYLKNRFEDSTSSRELSLVLTGILFAVFLAYPLLCRQDFAEWTNGASIFRTDHEFYPKEGVSLGFLWTRFTSTLHAMFLGFTDRHDMSYLNEPFYNLPAIPVVLLGIAWALVRFDLGSLFWTACVLVGLSPFALSFDGHSCRLVGLVTPSFLLSAIGIDAWWGALRRAPTGRVWAFLGGLAILAYGAWNVGTMDYRFYTKLREHPSTTFLLYQDMRKVAANHRIYYWQEFTEASFYSVGPLADQHFDVFTVLPGATAPVPVPPGGKTPDVALYFSLRNKPGLKRLLHDFPKARVESIPWYGDGPNPPRPTLARAIIRGEDLKPLKDPAHPPLLYTVPVPASAWRRIVFITHAGLGIGAIAGEDFSTQLSAALPVTLQYNPGWALGTFLAPKNGYYRFSTTTANYALLDIDEARNVLDLKPTANVPETQEGSIYLKAGTHRIRLRTYFQSGFTFPDIRVYYPGQTASMPLELPPASAT